VRENLIKEESRSLLPEIERQQKLGKEVVFRADAAGSVVLPGIASERGGLPRPADSFCGRRPAVPRRNSPLK